MSLPPSRVKTGLRLHLVMIKFKLAEFLPPIERIAQDGWPCWADISFSDLVTAITITHKCLKFSKSPFTMELSRVRRGMIAKQWNRNFPRLHLTPDADVDVHLSIDYIKDTIAQLPLKEEKQLI